LYELIDHIPAMQISSVQGKKSIAGIKPGQKEELVALLRGRM